MSSDSGTPPSPPDYDRKRLSAAVRFPVDCYPLDLVPVYPANIIKNAAPEHEMLSKTIKWVRTRIAEH